MKTRTVTRNVAGLICLTAILLPCKAANTESRPDAGTHPIVDMQSGYLLGGSMGEKWLKPASVAKSSRGGETYRLYGPTQALGTGHGGRPKGQDAPCPDTLYVDFVPKQAKGAQVAVSGNWNALPRVPQRLPTTSPAYRTIVLNELRRHGLTNPTVKIDQIWRVDLDGDGKDEVLISANNYAFSEPGAAPPPDARAGDYSLLLLRRILRNGVQTSVLSGEYYPQARKFNAPNDAHIAACLDVNGDRKMEIIIRERYYEGDATSIYQMGSKTIKPVLTSGCGA